MYDIFHYLMLPAAHNVSKVLCALQPEYDLEEHLKNRQAALEKMGLFLQPLVIVICEDLSISELQRP